MNGYELVRLQPQQVKKSGDTITGNLTATVGAKFVGNLQGNADTATRLQTARQINGTNFNGSGNITTANWGTARSIQIGNTAKQVNGSGNVTWNLNEIGAAASNHTHNGGNVNLNGYTKPNQSSAISPNDTINQAIGKLEAGLGSHTHNYAGSNTPGGVATSAHKLQTARQINGVNFDGTRNITVYDNTKVSKTGDTMTGNLNMAADIIPTTNDARDFGNSNNRFRHLHLTGVVSTNNRYCESLLYLFNPNEGGQGVKLALNQANGTNLNELFYCVRNNATYLEPKYDGVAVGGSYLNSTGLGRNDKRFRDLWLVNGVIQTSDINTKENIEEIPTTSTKYKNGEITKENIYDTVKNITPIMFDYKGYENFDTKEGESFKQIGISAQELEQLNPALFKRVGTKGVIDENGVKTENYGIKTLAYTNMLLVALQETIKKVEALEKEIVELKSKI